jgi:hypothetical protein
MVYVVEMGSGAIIYIQSFIDWFRHSKAHGGSQTQTAWKSHKPTLGK